MPRVVGAPWRLAWFGVALAACAAPPQPWASEAAGVRAAAQAQGAELVLFFAIEGREQSDRMEQQALRDAQVLQALRDGGFRSLRLDGIAERDLFRRSIGGAEGMGIAVLDAEGQVYAARPGPQDAPELAAFLRRCAASRAALAALRSRLAARSQDGAAALELASLLLELGCRHDSEALLLMAAKQGEARAHHLLARLYALDGRLDQARTWLQLAPPSEAAEVTRGYVLFKERRHREAVEALAVPALDPSLGDDWLRARLYLGKALHECGWDADAATVLRRLSEEAPDTVFGAAALHSLTHLLDPADAHSH